ncbi:unnamed protein product [Microthlaspi erraticum]|uniref:Reverse transcriptase domain-containing protein n=1 Tax=Microthlaspi erraticum TaxID=1685480 RepID=A0A6D2KRY9_9BRAS|nr:unnamed protein product [Microthlaspi erraticum]
MAQAGDKNTKFFHSVTKARRIRNNLNTILDENGTIQRGDEAIGDVSEKYFQNLFSSDQPSNDIYAKVFEGFETRVSDEINRDITKPVTAKEIEAAVFSIGPSRAPGPDGFSCAFYHHFWEDIEEIQLFFRQEHLSGVISENQAAFIPGRMITDNVIVAHEMYYALKSRKRQAKSYMALKTDITKAYDRLEWRFLEETMRHMGFCQQWISWIMKCVSSVNFKVLINGSPKGLIRPERGIRQGDPLSPYLFILCAEVLSHLMHQAGASRKVQGMKLSQSCPNINHLLFADDSLFFTLANQKSAKGIKEVLTIYEQASGQAVNLRKSAITFGRLVKPEVKRQMRRILGIHNEGGGGKYLGIPEQFTHKKTEMFEYIVDKVKERTQGWHKRFLSLGGKEVLLKSIATAMPVYSMNVFKLPKGICEEINSVLADFWWGSDQGKKNMHWFAWNRLCLPKSEGGIGFRDIERFNLALLGKQAWRLLQNPECLMARVMRGRYYSSGLRFVVGNGTTISAWDDPWLIMDPPRAPRPRDAELRHYQVNEWIKDDRSGWNEAIIREVVIKSGYWLAMHLPENPGIHTPSANRELNQAIWKLHTANKIKHFLWKIASKSLPTRATLRRRHIIRTSLCLRCCQQEETANHIFFECPYAQQVWRASGLFHSALFDPLMELETKLVSFLLNPTVYTSMYTQHQVLWVLWRIWKSRNVLIFQQKSIHWRSLTRYAMNDASEWIRAQEMTQEAQHQSNNDGREFRHRLWITIQGWVKCNYDGSFRGEDHNAKAGWIVRDDRGTYLGSGQAEAKKVSSAIEAEFQALIISMQNCWCQGYRHIIFEGDSRNVVNLVNNSSLNFVLFNWIREVWSWMAKFKDIAFTWVPREGNQAADLLATRNLPNHTNFVYHSYVPEFMSNVLHNDFFSSS